MGQTGTWSLKFSDEFTGTELDTTKWNANWHGAPGAVTPPVNGAELSCYDPDHNVVINGALIQMALPNTGTNGCRLRSGATAPYVSGLVESDGKFNFRYGYVEARVWLPQGAGTPTNWPAVWTDGTHWPDDGEIDVMEVLSGGATRWHVHSASGDIGSSRNTEVDAGWHVFAADWEPDGITFFYDGRNVGTANVSIDADHYLILNHAIGTGSVKSVPAPFLVDYIRVWDSAGERTSNPPDSQGVDTTTMPTVDPTTVPTVDPTTAPKLDSTVDATGTAPTEVTRIDDGVRPDSGTAVP